jgi:hypothetical protein
MTLDSVDGEPMDDNTVRDLRVKMHDDRRLVQSIADVIDNSIDAGAYNIEIYTGIAEYFGKQSFFVIIADDGDGIPRNKLTSSMSFGSERVYQPWELGSFGVGLKDSTLAQASEITIISKIENHDEHSRRLSAAVVAEKKAWKLLNENEIAELGWDNTEPMELAKQLISERDKGTILILEDMHSLDDNLVGDQGHDESYHSDIDEWIENYLGLIYHRYIDGVDIGPRNKENPLAIYMNPEGNEDDEKIQSIDPFMKQHIYSVDNPNGTLVQDSSKPLTLRSSEHEIEVSKYILPNEDMREEFSPGIDASMIYASNREMDLNDLQGIYFIRNERIIDWPFNGTKWRNGPSGVGDSHHTTARWEVTLPHSITNVPTLLDPSKTRVNIGLQFKQLLEEIGDEIHLWSTFDLEEYGYIAQNGNRKTEWLGGDRRRTPPPGKAYGPRARARNDKHDVPHFCSTCENRVRILYEGDICDACAPETEPENPNQDEDSDQPTLDDFIEGEGTISDSGDEEDGVDEEDVEHHPIEIRESNDQQMPNKLLEFQIDENLELVFVNTEHRLFSKLEEWFSRR